MNRTHIIISTGAAKLLRTLAGGIVLAGLVLVALYGFEAGPVRNTADVAEAWNCVSLTATPNTIVEGETTKLTWSFGAQENGVYVTIDQIDATQYPGTQGSVDTKPSQTTTYTATAHRPDTTKTFTCHAKVTVTPKPTPAPVCEIHVNPSTITSGATTTVSWTSENAASMSITGLGTVPLNSQRDVVLTSNTTYTGTAVAADGRTATCEKTVTVTTPPTETPGPVCTMSVSPIRVRAGESVTLTWTSERATSATISPTIGSVAVNGSASTTVSSDTTYSGVFTAADGRTVPCSAAVTIETTTVTPPTTGGGGGGRCMNCGDDDDDDDTPSSGGTTKKSEKPKPTIVLSKTLSAAPGFVYLNQVPYTGFTAGPILTTVFWLSILALSAGIAYVLTVMQPLRRFRTAFASSSPVAVSPIEESYAPEAQQSNAAYGETETASINMTMQVAQPSTLAQHETQIEDRAHQENILLSPEALRMIKVEIERKNGDTNAVLAGVFAAAKAQFASEDGWILLSKERAQTILARSTEGETESQASMPAPTPAPAHIAGPMHDVEVRNSRPSVPLGSIARAPGDAPRPTQPIAPQTPTQPTAATPAQANTSTPRTSSTDASISTFVGWLVSGEEQKVFEFVRNVTVSGTSAEQFIGNVVRKLDDVYKNRLEGNHNPDKDLATITASWSTSDFEHVLGILVECIDFSYASNRIGTKVALAKAFEYFKSK